MVRAKSFQSSTNQSGRRPRRSEPGKPPCRVVPYLEALEDRVVPSTTAYPTLSSPSLSASPSASNTPGGAGYTPSEIAEAYGFNLAQFSNGTAGNGAGQTVAIIDAYNDPDIRSDLNTFSYNYGLPLTTGGQFTFTVENQTGGTTLPANSTSWAVEESLDVEWVHALAPQANILLVEANSSQLGDLMTAVDTARNTAGVSVVSMSFGAAESQDESAYDGHFTTPAGHAGVTFVASAGDFGQPDSYPAASPNVLAVGGTALTIGLAGTGTLTLPATTQEQGWQTGGGGGSAYEPAPSYQSQVFGIGAPANRIDPDVAFAAADGTGLGGVVNVIDSYNTSSATMAVAGTSVGAPPWSALIAIADQGRALDGLGSLDGPSQTLPAIYSLPASDFNDITSNVTGQFSGPGNAATAGPGFDDVTGRGTPKARQVIADLSGNAPPSSVFTDNFQRSSLGSNYDQETGTVAIVSNKVEPNTTAQTVVAYLGASLADVYETASVTIPDLVNGQQAGLVARYQGSGDQGYYLGLMYWDPAHSVYDAGIFYYPVSGNGSALTTVQTTLTPADGALTGTLGFDVVGSELDVLWNGQLEARVFNASLPGAGLAGLEGLNGTAGASVSLTNFNVYSAPPFTDNFSSGTSLSGNWTTQAGSFQISSGTLQATGSGGNVATVNAESRFDESLGVNVNVPNTSGAYAALVILYNGPGNSDYSEAGITSNGTSYTADIWSVGSTGTMSVVDSVALTGGGTGHLAVLVEDDELVLSWNGDQVLATSEPGFFAAPTGLAGSSGVSFSNFTLGPASSFTDQFPSETELQGDWARVYGSTAFLLGHGTVNGQTIGIIQSEASGASEAVYADGMYTNVNVAAYAVPASSSDDALLVARYQGAGATNYYEAGLVGLGNGNYTAAIWYVNGSTATQFSTSYTVTATQMSELGGIIGLSLYASGPYFGLYATLPVQINPGKYEAVTTLVASGTDANISTAGGVGVLLTGSNTLAFGFSVDAGLPNYSFTGGAGPSVSGGAGLSLPAAAPERGSVPGGPLSTARAATPNAALSDLVFGSDPAFGVPPAYGPAGPAATASDRAFLTPGELWFAANLASTAGSGAAVLTTVSPQGAGAPDTDFLAATDADWFASDPAAGTLRLWI